MADKLQYKSAPQRPGVYFFKNHRGKILYIGKALNLRSRLSSYFSKNASPKTMSLLGEGPRFDWQETNSEIEALIKEADLIKRYRPKYNVLMRDDKNYFFVGFTKEKFPRIFLTHQPEKSAGYLGPFTDGGKLRLALKILRKAFPYCTCKGTHPRLCLNGKIGRCPGYCCLKSQRGEKAAKYRDNVFAVKKILSGKNKSLLRSLKKDMKKLSDEKKYEEAAETRDKMLALKKIFEHKSVIMSDASSEENRAWRSLENILGVKEIKRIEAYDIANIGGNFAYGSMAVWENGRANKNAYRIFKIKNVFKSDDPAMIREVISRRARHSEWPYPEVIIVDGGKQQLNAARSVLRQKQVNQFAGFADFSARSPLRSEKSKQPSQDRASGPRMSKLTALDFAPKIIALTKNKKHVGDHIFLGSIKKKVPLDPLPFPLKNLILRIDSEAHRFAIRHYRKLHRKSLFR